jgi:hypothetical protein
MITIEHNRLTQTTTASIPVEDLEHLGSVKRGHLIAFMNAVKDKCKEGCEKVKETWEDRG